MIINDKQTSYDITIYIIVALDVINLCREWQIFESECINSSYQG